MDHTPFDNVCPMCSISQLSLWVFLTFLSILPFHRSGNSFTMPDDLLDTAQTGRDSPNARCEDIHFIEYSSQQWFYGNGEPDVMNNEVSTTQTGRDSPNARCEDIHFIEYSSQPWFYGSGEPDVMNNEVSNCGPFTKVSHKYTPSHKV